MGGCTPLIGVLTFKPATASTCFRAIPFVLIFLRTLLHVAKAQLFCFQAIPNSLRKNTRVGGYPLPPQESQFPSGSATQRENVQRSAAEQPIKAGRNPFTEVGDPEGGDDSGEYIHGVMRAQDQDGGHLEQDEQDSSGREPLSIQARQLNRPENRDGGMPGEEKIVGDMIGHQERRETWVVPDHAGWRRQRAEGLHQLAQGHEQEQSEERANASAEKPAPQQKKSQRVDQTGAYDQQRVGCSGISRKIRIEPRRKVVERVADAGCRSGSGSDQ